jgi:hypothetical protein
MYGRNLGNSVCIDLDPPLEETQLLLYTKCMRCIDHFLHSFTASGAIVPATLPSMFVADSRDASGCIFLLEAFESMEQTQYSAKLRNLDFKKSVRFLIGILSDFRLPGWL